MMLTLPAMLSSYHTENSKHETSTHLIADAFGLVHMIICVSIPLRLRMIIVAASATVLSKFQHSKHTGLLDRHLCMVLDMYSF